MEVKWHEIDPATEEHRYYEAEMFAGEWKFRRKTGRRGEWRRIKNPTRAMWEEVLEYLQRAYVRRLATPEQIRAVKKILGDLPPAPPDDSKAQDEQESE